MTRVADLTADGKQRVEMYYRIGKALDEKLGDRSQAQERYEMALDLEPAHLPTLGALRRSPSIRPTGIARRATSIRSSSTRRRPRQRAKFLVELGQLRDETLSEHEAGIQAYELALQCDPDNEDAALPLVNEYINREKWAEAEPLADLLVRKKAASASAASSTDVEPARPGRDGARQGRQGAQGLPSSPPARSHRPGDDQRARRRLLPAEDWAGALTNYQKVLTALDEEDVEGRANVYFKLGCIKQEQGQAKQAINNFEKALAVEADSPRHARGAGRRLRRAKDWKQVCRLQAADPRQRRRGGERFKMLVEIGDIWSTKRRTRPRPSRPSKKRSTSSRRNHVLLHKLLQLYQATSNWPQMIDIAADHRRARDAARSARAKLHLHDGPDLPRQGRRLRSRGRALQRVARSQSVLPRGVRAHQQDPHASRKTGSSSSAPTARCSTASPARGTPISSTTCGTSSASSTAIG